VTSDWIVLAVAIADVARVVVEVDYLVAWIVVVVQHFAAFFVAVVEGMVAIVVEVNEMVAIVEVNVMVVLVLLMFPQYCGFAVAIGLVAFGMYLAGLIVVVVVLLLYVAAAVVDFLGSFGCAFAVVVAFVDVAVMVDFVMTVVEVAPMVFVELFG